MRGKKTLDELFGGKTSEKMRKLLLRQERVLRKQQPKAWTLKYRKFARPKKSEAEKEAEEKSRPDWARADYKMDENKRKAKKKKR